MWWNETFVNGSASLLLNNTQGRIAHGERFTVSLLNQWGETDEFKVWWLLQRKWLRSFRFLYPFTHSKDCQLRFWHQHTLGQVRHTEVKGKAVCWEKFSASSLQILLEEIVPPFLNHRKWYKGRVASLPDDWGDTIKYGKKNKVWDLIGIKYDEAVSPALFRAQL